MHLCCATFLILFCIDTHCDLGLVHTAKWMNVIQLSHHFSKQPVYMCMCVCTYSVHGTLCIWNWLIFFYCIAGPREHLRISFRVYNLSDLLLRGVDFVASLNPYTLWWSLHFVFISFFGARFNRYIICSCGGYLKKYFYHVKRLVCFLFRVIWAIGWWYSLLFITILFLATN